MHESTPTPEKNTEKSKSPKELFKQKIDNFLNRSDEPGKFLSDEEKEIFLKKIDPEDPKSLEEWKKHKMGSKYRMNSLSIPLAAGEIFLKSEEAINVPLESSQELLERIEEAKKLVKEGYGKPYSASDVKKVVKIANDIKKYL